jgi:hypothetical protein
MQVKIRYADCLAMHILGQPKVFLTWAKGKPKHSAVARFYRYHFVNSRIQSSVYLIRRLEK